MRKLHFGAGTVVGMLVALGAGLGGATALAAQPTPATIQEASAFVGGHQGPVGTFTASGIAGCTGGSFSDKLVSFIPSGARPVVHRTYVCDDGDTFTARVALHLGTIDAAGNQTAEGTWRIIAATGGLADLAGSGSTAGLNSGCSPVGTALGECATGVGTVTASVQ
jgi:hypothetical protein